MITTNLIEFYTANTHTHVCTHRQKHAHTCTHTQRIILSKATSRANGISIYILYMHISAWTNGWTDSETDRQMGWGTVSCCHAHMGLQHATFERQRRQNAKQSLRVSDADWVVARWDRESAAWHGWRAVCELRQDDNHHLHHHHYHHHNHHGWKWRRWWGIHIQNDWLLEPMQSFQLYYADNKCAINL